MKCKIIVLWILLLLSSSAIANSLIDSTVITSSSAIGRYVKFEVGIA